MRNSLDVMISLAKSFSSEVSVSRDCNDRIMVDIPKVSWRENNHDIMARSLCGRGVDVFSACSDYLGQASGKILFGNDKNYYGENAPSFICLGYVEGLK